jgi:hypothetical protein
MDSRVLGLPYTRSIRLENHLPLCSTCALTRYLILVYKRVLRAVVRAPIDPLADHGRLVCMYTSRRGRMGTPKPRFHLQPCVIILRRRMRRSLSP